MTAPLAIASITSTKRCSWCAKSSAARAGRFAQAMLVRRKDLIRVERHPVTRSSAWRKSPSGLTLGLRVERRMFGVMRGNTWSPEKSTRFCGSHRQRCPGECPGVHKAKRDPSRAPLVCRDPSIKMSGTGHCDERSDVHRGGRHEFALFFGRSIAPQTLPTATPRARLRVFVAVIDQSGILQPG